MAVLTPPCPIYADDLLNQAGRNAQALEWVHCRASVPLRLGFRCISVVHHLNKRFVI